MASFLLKQDNDYLLKQDGDRLILNEGAAPPAGGTLIGILFETEAISGLLIEGPSLQGELYEGIGYMSEHREFWLLDEDNTLEVRGVTDPSGNPVNTGVINGVLRQGTKQNQGAQVAAVSLSPLGVNGDFVGVLDKAAPTPPLVFGQTYTMFYSISVGGLDGAWSSQKKADYRGRK